MAERLARKPEKEETLDDYLMYLRHLAAYNFALSFCPKGRIVDLGCGTGYGTELIAATGNSIAGVDVAGYSLPRVKKTDTANFFVGDIGKLPFQNNCFDLVVSFQVIEHLKDASLYLSEAGRILTQNGVMIISTPNRNLRLWPLESPWNEYHVTEYSQTQLKLLLKKYFTTVDVLGLQAIPEIELAERVRLHQIRTWRYRNLVLEIIQRLPFGNDCVQACRKIKQRFLARIATKKSSLETALNSSKSFQAKYSSKDFWVSEVGVNRRMDLIAVCRK